MKAVIQRVSQASVTVREQIIGQIGSGLVVLLGVERGDTDEDAVFLASKIANLRIFEDSDGKMNHSLLEMGGSILAISQFTLLGDTRKGRRPSWHLAAEPAEANRLYQAYIAACQELGIPVAQGEFQAMMSVALVNEGPVTLWIDSRMSRRGNAKDAAGE